MFKDDYFQNNSFVKRTMSVLWLPIAIFVLIISFGISVSSVIVFGSSISVYAYAFNGSLIMWIVGLIANLDRGDRLEVIKSLTKIIVAPSLFVFIVILLMMLAKYLGYLTGA